jgi:hypothetical protein
MRNAQVQGDMERRSCQCTRTVLMSTDRINSPSHHPASNKMDKRTAEQLDLSESQIRTKT